MYEKGLALAALGSVTFCLHPWEPFVLGSPCPSERCAEGQQIKVSKKAWALVGRIACLWHPVKTAFSREHFCLDDSEAVFCLFAYAGASITSDLRSPHTLLVNTAGKTILCACVI